MKCLLLLPIFVFSICLFTSCGESAGEKMSRQGKEFFAYSRVQSIHNANLQFIIMPCQDGDKDGKGRYGFFDELSGLVDLNGFSPELLSGDFKTTDNPVLTEGYYIQILLPKVGGGVYTSSQEMKGANEDAAEEDYRIYAWPENDTEGHKMFFTDRTGIIHVKQIFDGVLTIPTWDDFETDSTRWRETDAQRWREKELREMSKNLDELREEFGIKD